MQINKLAYSSSTSSNQENNLHSFVDQIATSISFKFNQCLQLNQTDNSNHSHANDDDISDEEEFVDCEDNENDDNNNKNHEYNGDHFTSMYINEKTSHASVDKTSKNRQTNSALPLFDQTLLSKEFENQLPIQPHADNVFIKSPDQRAPSSSTSTSEYDDCEGVAVGPYRTWSKQQHAKENGELNKKSNSTGFSKLWRLRGKLVGRSNSDGPRDAFVFLRRPADRKTKTSSKMVVKRTAVGGSLVKANIDHVDGAKTKVVKIGTKAQNANVSAHEVYLRKKEQTEEERRRSYLPYRPEIMGFFTNVSGGCLSKNVHPY